jgi:hypothetical protein
LHDLGAGCCLNDDRSDHVRVQGAKVLVDAWCREREREPVAGIKRAFDLKSLLLEATVCGVSSSLSHLTVVPIFTVNCCGAKVKLSIFTVASAARAGVIETTATPARTAT